MVHQLSGIRHEYWGRSILLLSFRRGRTKKIEVYSCSGSNQALFTCYGFFFSLLSDYRHVFALLNVYSVF